jgi:hypothetical protein
LSPSKNDIQQQSLKRKSTTKTGGPQKKQNMLGNWVKTITAEERERNIEREVAQMKENDLQEEPEEVEDMVEVEYPPITVQSTSASVMNTTSTTTRIQLLTIFSVKSTGERVNTFFANQCNGHWFSTRSSTSFTKYC